MKTNKLATGVRLALLTTAIINSAAIASEVSVQLASKAITGVSNGDSFNASLSADGRYLAYQSIASNLVPGDTNNAYDIFVFDRDTSRIERVSVSSSGEQGDKNSVSPSISADGRYVMFSSDATNLVSGDTNARSDTFVHDRITGTTTRVSVDANGNQGSLPSLEGMISADGRYVGFRTFQSFDPTDTNGTTDIYVKDTLLGTIKLVTRSSSGNSNHGGISTPVMSGDATVFGWISNDPSFVPGDTNNFSDVIIYDTKTGVNKRVSRGINGAQPNNTSFLPALNYDGTKVLFSSEASNIVPGDTNAVGDVFLFDVATATTTRVSLSDTNQQLDRVSRSRLGHGLSADGKTAAFHSQSTNAAVGKTSILFDVYVRDLIAGKTQIVSKTHLGEFANGPSLDGLLSADGRYVGYRSLATDLTDDEVGPRSDMYLVDRVSNNAPFAFAGHDQLIEATAIQTPVTLDGSGSSDPDGDTLSYTWTGSFGIASGVNPVVAFGLGTHDITLSLDDGNGGYADDQVQIIVQDTTPPVLTVPADLRVIATGPQTQVNLGTASADDIFGASLTNDAPATFPVGETIVTYTATDPNGNQSTAQQRVSVNYSFGGFASPISPGKAYKLGRTLPVKFQLFYADGSVALDATATIRAQRIESDVPAGEPIVPTSTSGSDSGNSFRLADDHYQYNLNTGFASQGTYHLIIEINDGTTQIVEIAFK